MRLVQRTHWLVAHALLVASTSSHRGKEKEREREENKKGARHSQGVDFVVAVDAGGVSRQVRPAKLLVEPRRLSPHRAALAVVPELLFARRRVYLTPTRCSQGEHAKNTTNTRGGGVVEVISKHSSFCIRANVTKRNYRSRKLLGTPV